MRTIICKRVLSLRFFVLLSDSTDPHCTNPFVQGRNPVYQGVNLKSFSGCFCINWGVKYLTMSQALRQTKCSYLRMLHAKVRGCSSFVGAVTKFDKTHADVIQQVGHYNVIEINKMHSLKLYCYKISTKI